MKILCTKKNLNQGLLTTSRIIGSANTLPILNNILLKTDKGQLKLSSTNLEMAVSTWVAGKVEEEGEITIPAKLINEYITNLLADKITLQSEKQNLTVEGENAKTHIKGMSAEEFPLIPEVGEDLYTKVNGKELGKTLKEVGFAAAYSETQPEISGVLFDFEGKILTLAATDRYRLAEGKIALEAEVSAPRQLIIPARAVAEISRIASDGVVEVFLKEGQVCFKTAGVELVSRQIEGQFPDYKQIIPNNFTTETVVERVGFVQALKAASLFATESNNIELELNPQTKQVLIKSQSAQTGDSEIRLTAVDISGGKNSIIFNYRYLLECLNNLADEDVTLKVINPASPAEIIPGKRDNYLYIVMPIKI